MDDKPSLSDGWSSDVTNFKFWGPPIVTLARLKLQSSNFTYMAYIEWYEYQQPRVSLKLLLLFTSGKTRRAVRLYLQSFLFAFVKIESRWFRTSDLLRNL